MTTQTLIKEITQILHRPMLPLDVRRLEELLSPLVGAAGAYQNQCEVARQYMNQKDTLLAFINREMRMTGDDPRIAELEQLMVKACE